jgi:hypothetical protein
MAKAKTPHTMGECLIMPVEIKIMEVLHGGYTPMKSNSCRYETTLSLNE